MLEIRRACRDSDAPAATLGTESHAKGLVTLANWTAARQEDNTTPLCMAYKTQKGTIERKRVTDNHRFFFFALLCLR